jgi:NAD(P)-dependent dehydrogenase (short-subunit alcohol dehydrogenase family)
VGGIAPYISSKQAVLAVAETLQHDLRRLGSAVTVAAVLPGAIKSSMPEAFRHRQPEYGPAKVTDEVVEQSRAFLERYGEEPAVVARRIIDRVFDGDPFYVLTDSRDLVMSEDRIGGIRTGILGIPATPGVHGGEL